LAAVLRALTRRYYEGDPVVSDEIFDLMKEKLRERDPTNPFFKEIGVPIHHREKVKLPFETASLDKIKPETKALDQFIQQYSGPYVVSDKLDGIFGLFVKQGRHLSLYTRGDGEYGQEISHLIPFIPTLSRKIVGRLPDMAIRGELIIRSDTFAQVSGDYKNSRNAVGGLVNAKHANPAIAEITDFIGHGVADPPLTPLAQLRLLEEYGFPTVPYQVWKTLSFPDLSAYLEERRLKSPYAIDGIVVTDTSAVYPSSNENPDYAFAFKTLVFENTVEAKVIEVIWEESKWKYLIPTIRIEPVDLADVTITHATAFNAEYVFTHRLGPGAIVLITRSGDVIPYILKVVKGAEILGEPDLPYIWDKNHVNIIVDTEADSAMVKTKKLSSFFKILGIKQISDGIAALFVAAGYDDLFTLLRADRTALTQIEGLGEKSIRKIFDQVDQKLQTVDLPTLMAASLTFGRGFGLKRLKAITDVFPQIIVEDMSFDDLLTIDGMGEVNAQQFVDHLPAFRTFFDQLAEIVDLRHLFQNGTEETSTLEAGISFAGQKIVFTGFRDPELADLISRHGGTVATSVSKKTTLVVYKSKDGSKYQKAIDLGIKTEPLAQFKKTYHLA